MARRRKATPNCEEIEKLSKRQKGPRLEIIQAKKKTRSYEKLKAKRNIVIKSVKKLCEKRVNCKIDRMIEVMDSNCIQNIVALKSIKGGGK